MPDSTPGIRELVVTFVLSLLAWLGYYHKRTANTVDELVKSSVPRDELTDTINSLRLSHSAYADRMEKTLSEIRKENAQSAREIREMVATMNVRIDDVYKADRG